MNIQEKQLLIAQARVTLQTAERVAMLQAAFEAFAQHQLGHAALSDYCLARKRLLSEDSTEFLHALRTAIDRAGG